MTDTELDALVASLEKRALVMTDDPVYQRALDAIAALRAENARMEKQLDALLNHCGKENGECSVCARIICPHIDPMHFHHDGCPSCAEAE